MKELKDLLLALGVSSEVITELTQEDKPDDFNTAAKIAEVVSEREQFYVDKLTPQVEADYKKRTEAERYASTIKPIQSRLAKKLKELGATEEEIKAASNEIGVDPKKGIDLMSKLADRKAEQAQEGKKGDDVEALKTAREEINKWKEIATEREELLESKNEEIEQLGVKYEQEKNDFVTSFERDRYFNNVLKGESFQGMKKLRNADKVLKLYMEEHGYSIGRSEDGNWLPVGKDGTKAISIDGKRTYKNVEEMLVDVARHGQLFPEHNGGKDRKVGNHERVIDGKKFNNEGVDFLEQSMRD